MSKQVDFSTRVVAAGSLWADGPSRSVPRVLVRWAVRADGVMFASWRGQHRDGGFRSVRWSVVPVGGGCLYGVDIPGDWVWRGGDVVPPESPDSARLTAENRLPKLAVSVAVVGVQS